jgi:hypothetical protein
MFVRFMDMLSFLRKKEGAGSDYYSLLPRIHSFLKPAAYAEIGIRHGASLRMATTAKSVVGIDPGPQIEGRLAASICVFKMTSDDFFASRNLTKELRGKTFDLAFIDGMHLFEFALRDFINLERASSPRSTILVHDCYPVDRITAERERTTQIWSGDVWKLIVCLKKYRPDLHVSTIDVPPTGLGVIRGLDAKSEVLSSRLDDLCEEFIPCSYDLLESNKPAQLNRVANRWNEIKAILTD